VLVELKPFGRASNPEHQWKWARNSRTRGMSLRHIAITGVIAGSDARRGPSVADAARLAGHGGTPGEHRDRVNAM